MFLGAAATSHGALFPPPGSSVARYVGRDDSWSELLHLRCSSSWLSWLCFIEHAWRPLFLFAGALGVYSVMKKKNLSCVYVCVSLARIVPVILSVSSAGLSNFFTCVVI